MFGWWSHLSRFTKVVAAIAGLATAITAVSSAWVIVEPWYWATRGYVRDRVSDHDSQDIARSNAIIDTLIDLTKAQVARLEHERSDFEKQLSTTNGPQMRELMLRLIEGRTEEIGSLRTRIHVLEHLHQ